MPEFDPRPIVLERADLRLEPLRLDHAEALFAIASPDTFRYFLNDFPEWTIECFTEYLVERMQPDQIAFVAIRKSTGEVAGMSSYLDIRIPHRGLEVGYTFYGEAFRRTRVNPECKLMLLGHAFEDLGAERVQLKCNAKNEPSRGAMLKMGAQFEGILRSHLVLPDGTMRDTAMFSVIASEWPSVKAGLLARLA